MLRIESLGCGRQSSTIFLMSCLGELPKLDHAIFADTGDETADVYEYRDFLADMGRQHGVEVHTVSRQGPAISEHAKDRVTEGRRLDKPPFWTHGKDGREACINRDCTREWKISVIRRKTKELLGLKPAARWPKELAVETWLGIAADERRRMKVSVEPWQRYWHPLLEEPWVDGYAKLSFDAMTTEACLAWIRKHGFPEPPYSSCWHCPFRGNRRWRDLRDNHPDDWEKACQLDEHIRTRRIHGMGGDVYLHRSLVPLRIAQIDDTDKGSLFGDECSGVCGV